jgi:hypothetical protein
MRKRRVVKRVELAEAVERIDMGTGPGIKDKEEGTGMLRKADSRDFEEKIMPSVLKFV